MSFLELKKRNKSKLCDSNLWVDLKNPNHNFILTLKLWKKTAPNAFNRTIVLLASKLHIVWPHFKSRPVMGQHVRVISTNRQIHSSLHAWRLPHELLQNLTVSLTACLSAVVYVMMNEPPPVAKEAPSVKVTALSKLSHFEELPSLSLEEDRAHLCKCSRIQ